MRRLPQPLVVFLALLLWCGGTTADAQRKVMVVGDSLSREYQFEFPAFPDARNWVEILAAHRSSHLDFGDIQEIPISVIEPVCDIFSGDICDALGGAEDDLMGHRYNWSVPTFRAEQYADLLTGESFLQERFQDFFDDDFNEVDSVVIFLGGNDLDAAYESIYNGEVFAINMFVIDVFTHLTAIVDFVKGRAPSMEIVLVSVPHVGATPEVKSEYPFDEEMTGRVTTAVDVLNSDLAFFAQQEGIAFADITTLTKDLVEPDIYCIGGVEFFNAGTETGDARFLWLGGSVSQNFHPNTAGQALVADAIVAALNETYSADIARFGSREILEDLLGMDADLPLSEWAAGFGLGPGENGPFDDPEGDGYINLLEFGLDGDPSQADSALEGQPVKVGSGVSLSFRPRDPFCEYVRVIAEESADLRTWSEVPSIDNEDGTFTAITSLPFLRLRVEVIE